MGAKEHLNDLKELKSRADEVRGACPIPTKFPRLDEESDTMTLAAKDFVTEEDAAIFEISMMLGTLQYLQLVEQRDGKWVVQRGCSFQPKVTPGSKWADEDGDYVVVKEVVDGEVFFTRPEIPFAVRIRTIEDRTPYNR